MRIKAEINLENIRQNLLNVRAKIGEGTKLCAVIKADGYGHGAVEIFKNILDIADFFAVATIEEALELRKICRECPILILGYIFPEGYADAIKNDIDITVFTLCDAKKISKEAEKIGKKAKIHIALDTGMGRIGFDLSEKSLNEVFEICSLSGIKAEGIFTHFATADEADKAFTLNQKAEFDGFCQRLFDMGAKIPIRHIANSAAIMDFEDFGYEMARCGIVTYGLYPSNEVLKSNLELAPAMSLKSHISHIKKVPEGTPISYGATYKTESEATIATVPVGYADGYPRHLSNCGRVLINGKSAQVVGRICMDQFMVDISGISANVGDEVILIGKSGEEEITADEIAEKVGTINYEIICGIGKRVPRIYIQ